MSRKSISQTVRWRIFARDDFTCRYCGVKPPDAVLHVDHVHPVSKGGRNDEANLVTACETCNGGKSDKLIPLAKADTQKEIVKYGQIMALLPEVADRFYAHVIWQTEELKNQKIQSEVGAGVLTFAALTCASLAFHGVPGFSKRQFMKYAALIFDDVVKDQAGRKADIDVPAG